MRTSRRHFIQTAGAGMIGLGLSPVFHPLWQLWDAPFAGNLPRASPESQGVSSQAIRQFITAANESGISWHSFMLLRHGHVVAEGWWKPFAPAFTHSLYSLSKSFTSTAIGLLVKEGKLDIHKPVISFFPQDTPATPSENLQKMTVRHLLTMNTGHVVDTLPQLKASPVSWTQTFLAQPVPFVPGTHFLYNTGATYMLGAIVYQITGETLEKYLAPRLFQPLGITGYDWETSPQGLNTAGYGLRVKTEDIAKFGQLYLQKGNWGGQAILTDSWVQEATSFQTTSQAGSGDWAQGYGYQFWRCKPGGYRGDGAYGQYCIVMPDQDAVLAVTSQSPDMQKSLTIIWDHLLPAMQISALAGNPADFTALQKELTSLTLPVVTGSTQSSLSSLYHDKKWQLANNDMEAQTMQFAFSSKGCTWTTTVAEKETTLQFGWEHWLLNQDRQRYPFPEADLLPMPSKMAGTATWINDHTLQLNARFVEAIHGDTITCVFEGDRLSISFVNSFAAISPLHQDARKPLSGMMIRS